MSPNNKKPAKSPFANAGKGAAAPLRAKVEKVITTKPLAIPPPPTEAPTEDGKLYDFQVRAFTSEGIVQLTSSTDIPRTKVEIGEMLMKIKQDGMVFLSPDRMTSTTFMPNDIKKIVVTTTEHVGEDK